MRSETPVQLSGPASRSITQAVIAQRRREAVKHAVKPSERALLAQDRHEGCRAIGALGAAVFWSAALKPLKALFRRFRSGTDAQYYLAPSRW